MEKVTVFSASNRNDNKTRIFADYCRELLEKEGSEVRFYSLEDLPSEVTHQSIYTHPGNPLQGIVDKFIAPSDRMVFVFPEYNGSFPGILKIFIDAIHPEHFYGKKAALVGISAGRSGNVRGMDHLTNILNYLKVEVYSNKLPISVIGQLINGQDELTDQVTKELLGQQMTGFLKF